MKKPHPKPVDQLAIRFDEVPVQTTVNNCVKASDDCTVKRGKVIQLNSKSRIYAAILEREMK